ncbi:hypothetical protein ERICIV_03739 [Paenibacillus larvae subsp. larvae]|uniref:Uncharacterized protein n=1 Tax=Paenibacillus larvae subsp. larvae TaxID=147375 RepID=A0A2L1U598_9BACL|nr:hypothetical protein ERICIII_03996 [Paenibacillus larvae subsp. larvae]AVF32584.1 hypothetical protein ERICIV_03739 [Paenibacillus larvae subsp. larvae]
MVSQLEFKFPFKCLSKKHRDASFTIRLFCFTSGLIRASNGEYRGKSVKFKCPALSISSQYPSFPSACFHKSRSLASISFGLSYGPPFFLLKERAKCTYEIHKQYNDTGKIYKSHLPSSPFQKKADNTCGKQTYEERPLHLQKPTSGENTVLGLPAETKELRQRSEL